MSFQRITHHRVDAGREQGGDRRRADSRSPSFSSRWISTRCGGSSLPLRSAAQRRRDVLGGADEHVGELPAPAPSSPRRRRGRAGRRPPRRSRRCRRARRRARARRRRRARAPARPVAREPVEDVVRDPVALLLAQQDVAGEAGLLGVVREQVAQQQRRALDVARRTPRTARAARGPAWACAERTSGPTVAAPAARARGSSQPVHSLFTGAVTGWRARRGSLSQRWSCARDRRCSAPGIWRSGPRIISRSPPAAPLPLSVRELDAARRRWSAARAASSRARSCTRRSGARRCARSDRSVDVYVHKLRSSSARRSRSGGSSTRTSASATASRRSLHTLFTRATAR